MKANVVREKCLSFQVNVTENRIEFSLTINGKTKSINLEAIVVNFLNYVRRKLKSLQKSAPNANILELVLSVTGARDVQAVLSVPSRMTQTSNQDLIRYRKKSKSFPLMKIVSS